VRELNVIPSTGVAWGFTGQDVFKNAALIVSSLGTFVIIFLAVSFAPRIINVLQSIFGHDDLIINDEDDDEEEDD